MRVTAKYGTTVLPDQQETSEEAEHHETAEHHGTVEHAEPYGSSEAADQNGASGQSEAQDSNGHSSEEYSIVSQADQYGSIEESETSSSASSPTALECEKSVEGRRRLIVGILLTLMSCLAWTLSIPCLQLLDSDVINSMELLFLAYAAHLVCSMPVWIICWRKLKTLVWEESQWMLLTASVTALSNACFYLCAEVLPSGIVGVVSEGTFLLLSVIATGILDRHITKLIIVATVVCIIGQVLFSVSSFVIDPITAQMSNITLMGRNVHDTRKAALHGYHPALAYVVLVISAGLSVVANVIVHCRLAKVSFVKVLLYFPVIGFVTSAMMCFAVTKPPWSFDISKSNVYLPFSGFLFLFTMSMTFQYASWMRTPAPIFGLISAGSIVMYFILQYSIPVPGIHPGKPDALELVGAIMIILANVIGPISELEIGSCQGWCRQKGQDG